MESSPEIQNIIDELRSDSIPSPVACNIVPQTQELVKDENVNAYVYEKTAEVIQAGLEAIQSLKNNIMMGADPKEVSAMAQLIGATTKAIDSLNSLNLQQKQAATAVELKKMDIAGKKEIVSKLPASNNILIATRDEVISRMMDKPRRNPVDLIESD
jgi:hypothetical protein